MTIRPCDFHVNCPGTDSPFLNLSSEAPDPNVYIGLNFGWDYNFPRLNWTFDNPTAVAFCTSAVSQHDADLCSQNNQVGQQTGGWTDPTGNKIPLFRNGSQACFSLCPDGLPFVYQVLPGVFTAMSQAQADSLAYQFACAQAAINRICLGGINGNAQVGTAYNSTIAATGAGNFTYSVVSGSLPPGLTLSNSNNTAPITGTPTSPGTFNFTVLVHSDAGFFMQKAYSIKVKGGVNWDNLLWFTQAQNLPSITPNPSPDGSASFTPFGSASATFTFATFSGVQPAEQSQSFNSGDVTYNGPACNCLLTIQLQQTGAAAQTISEVQVFDKFAQTTLFFDTGHLPTVNGTYTFPFTVPDTGGQTITIEVFATMVSASGNPVVASSLNITGTLSNV